VKLNNYVLKQDGPTSLLAAIEDCLEEQEEEPRDRQLMELKRWGAVVGFTAAMLFLMAMGYTWITHDPRGFITTLILGIILVVGIGITFIL